MDEELPKYLGLEMKSMYILCASAEIKTSLPSFLFSNWVMAVTCGLNMSAAFFRTVEHSPFQLRKAIMDGAQPSGPVAVTSTFRAPSL